jgi:hypothetical protein
VPSFAVNLCQRLPVYLLPVLRIHDILGWIPDPDPRIHAVTNGYGIGPGSWIRIMLFSSLPAEKLIFYTIFSAYYPTFRSCIYIIFHKKNSKRVPKKYWTFFLLPIYVIFWSGSKKDTVIDIESGTKSWFGFTKPGSRVSRYRYGTNLLYIKLIPDPENCGTKVKNNFFTPVPFGSKIIKLYECGSDPVTFVSQFFSYFVYTNWFRIQNTTV